MVPGKKTQKTKLEKKNYSALFWFGLWLLSFAVLKGIFVNFPRKRSQLW
jgi:hypothetical protein